MSGLIAVGSRSEDVSHLARGPRRLDRKLEAAVVSGSGVRGEASEGREPDAQYAHVRHPVALLEERERTNDKIEQRKERISEKEVWWSVEKGAQEIKNQEDGQKVDFTRR